MCSRARSTSTAPTRAGEWFVSKLDADGIDFTREHAKGDAAIRGRASDLLLWLWRRDARPVDIVGDAALAARFQQLSRLRMSVQPPIWLIDLPGRMKLTWLIWWPAHFVADGRLDHRRRGRRRCRRRSTSSSVDLGRGEQARAELALGGQAHAVAVAAERLGDRRDHADRATAVEVPPAVGRRRAARRHLLQREHGVDRGDDLVLADDLARSSSGRRRRAA